MKHFLLVLGLAIIPTKQENLQPLSPLAPPYIHTTILPQPLPQAPHMALVDALILVESCGNPNALELWIIKRNFLYLEEMAPQKFK